MIVLKDEGLYCPEGDFFIDPLLPCKNAVITHAHAAVSYTHLRAHETP